MIAEEQLLSGKSGNIDRKPDQEKDTSLMNTECEKMANEIAEAALRIEKKLEKPSIVISAVTALITAGLAEVIRDYLELEPVPAVVVGVGIAAGAMRLAVSKIQSPAIKAMTLHLSLRLKLMEKIHGTLPSRETALHFPGLKVLIENQEIDLANDKRATQGFDE